MIVIKQQLAVDPNWAKVSDQLSAVGGNPNNLVWTHLTPIAVIKNTKKHYIAKYRDEHGVYNFEIKRTKKGMFDVCVDNGQFVIFDLTKSKLVWEFENQINNNLIKCI